MVSETFKAACDGADFVTNRILQSNHFNFEARKRLAFYFMANGVSPFDIVAGLRHGMRDKSAVNHMKSLVGDETNPGDVLKWKNSTAWVHDQLGAFSIDGQSKRSYNISKHGPSCICHSCEAFRYSKYCASAPR